jgi:D-glycero-D-manno-heptose 1,7-bisphosphate phosphatase
MSQPAVFLDRDHTIIEDTGYLSDPAGVKLLPGVELALKSLARAGYKTVVATNQSSVARGMVTEEMVNRINAEMVRQLEERGANLDAIYYCPYHPAGTIEAYAIDSEMCKPKPGMLLKAAEEMDINLLESWMVGDRPRDVEAGQRAGCRTIRIRASTLPVPGEVQDEDVQADFAARNLVEAARIILREAGLAHPRPAAAPSVPGVEQAPPQPAPAPPPKGAEALSDRQVRLELLRYVRQLARAEGSEEFSFTKLIGGIVQVLAALALMVALWRMAAEAIQQAQLWATLAVVLQVMALTFFSMHRSR